MYLICNPLRRVGPCVATQRDSCGTADPLLPWLTMRPGKAAAGAGPAAEAAPGQPRPPGRPGRPSWRELFAIDRPPPATPATRRLRRLILLTAVATVAVEVLNLGYAEDGGTFGLWVRTIWALLRALGFLALMRTVRYGRMSARPFGLILTITTVFAVARLVQPRREALLPAWPALAGFVVLTVLCVLVCWQLYRSPAIAGHLTRKPPRRRVPPWVLTARIVTLSYGALLLIPCLVALGTLWDSPRLPLEYAVPIVGVWFAFSLAIGFALPWLGIFVVFGKRPARGLLAGLSVLVGLVQPVLCGLLLGVEGLLRDGVPLILTVLIGLYALWRSRDDPGGGAAPTGNGS